MAKLNGVKGIKMFLTPKQHPCVLSGVLCLLSPKVPRGICLKLEKLPRE